MWILRKDFWKGKKQAMWMFGGRGLQAGGPVQRPGNDRIVWGMVRRPAWQELRASVWGLGPKGNGIHVRAWTDLGFVGPESCTIKRKNWEGPSRWWRSKTWRSPSSPQIHQKYIYVWNSSYRTPTECGQKTSDFPKDAPRWPTRRGGANPKLNPRSCANKDEKGKSLPAASGAAIKSPQSTWCTLHLWNTWIDKESSRTWGGGHWEQL